MADVGDSEDVAEEALVWGSAYPPSINAGIPKLGDLPNGWSRLWMKDMLEVIERPVKLRDDHSYQLVTAKRSRGGIVSRGLMLGKDIKVKQQFEVRAGDFILSNRQIAHGGCGIVPPQLDGAVVSGEYTVLQPRAMLDLQFLHYLSHSAYFQQICFHSGVGVHVEKLVFRQHEWLNWEIDIPPLPTQQRIAEILGDFDQAIKTTDALVEAKQRRKRALMQRVFDENSNDATVKLASVGRFSKGRGIGKDDICDSGIPCLRYAEIYTLYGDVITNLISIVSNVEGANAARLQKGDIVFAGSGETALEIGKAVTFLGEESAVVGGDTVIFRGHRQDPAFLAYLLNSESVVRQKYKYGQGFSVVHIHASELGKIEVRLPDLSEQRAISNALLDCDREMSLLAEQSTNLRLQQRGLMQKLLAGSLPVAWLDKAVV